MKINYILVYSVNLNIILKKNYNVIKIISISKGGMYYRGKVKCSMSLIRKGFKLFYFYFS